MAQLTTVVINAGLGGLSHGLEVSGFKVVAAYEPDKKSCSIHDLNINAPVLPFSLEEIDATTFPNVDLLSARLHFPSSYKAKHMEITDAVPWLRNFHEILTCCSPRSFLLLFNVSAIKSESFHMFMDSLDHDKYQCTWQVVDIAKATGFPVREQLAFVIGMPRELEKSLYYPEYKYHSTLSPDMFLQPNSRVDPWYYCINTKDLSCELGENGSRILCWKKYCYTDSEIFHWNYRKPPLLRDDNTLRKITHREIANLKGLPSQFYLPEKNKHWLYQKLIYAENVLVVKQLAGMISNALTNNPWRNQQVERAMEFEDLFGRYLSKMMETNPESSFPPDSRSKHASQITDFTILHNGINLYFDTKRYNSNYALSSKVKNACARLSSLKETGTPILVIANEVPISLKDQCFEQFDVYVWDVANLLWLFDSFSDIKNEFIASLDFSIDHIEPTSPIPFFLQNKGEAIQEEPSWKKKLLSIKPGHEHFHDYELLCTEILKYVLGDYLTLWETQEKSNDGLYRFDLCCKIKSGANQDFFDTIKHYFNTKYIVFEFKNYSEKITQKEIYTTEKYLYEKALRKVAIIISRIGADDHALQAARGSLRENGKLIICLSDDSLLEMIDIKLRGEHEPAEFLGVILDDLLVHLEK